MAIPIQEFDEIEEFDAPRSIPLDEDEFERRLRKKEALPKPELESHGGLSLLGRIGSGIEKASQLPGKLLFGALDLGQSLPGSRAINYAVDELAPKPIADLSREMRELPRDWLKYYSDRGKKLAKEDAALDENSTIGRLAEGTSQAAFELPLNLVGGAANLGRQATMKAIAGAQGVISGLGKYGQERGEGAGRLESVAQGGASGLITGLTTRAFGNTGVESIFRNEGIKGVRNRIAQVLKDAGLEGFEEAADTFQQDLVERISKNPNKSIGESVTETLMAGSIGALLGGGVSAANQVRSGAVEDQPETIEEFPETEVSDAVVPETAQPVRPLRQEPVEGKSEMPGESTGGKADVRRGEEVGGKTEGKAEAVSPDQILKERGYRDAHLRGMTPEQKAAEAGKPKTTPEADANRYWELEDSIRAEPDMARRMAMLQEVFLERELIKNRNPENPGMPPERPKAEVPKPTAPTPESIAKAAPKAGESFGVEPLRNDKGEPIKLYRGLPSEAKPELEGGIGFFTSKPEVAEGYTSKRGVFLSRKTGKVQEANLSIKNPLIIDALGKRNDNIPVPWQEWKPKVYGNLPKNAVSVRAAAEYAKTHGYDGLIVKNVIDTVTTQGKDVSDVYAVFDQKQIIDSAKPKPTAATPESVAKEYGLEYRGEVGPGKVKVWQFHDPVTGSAVGVKAGSTPEAISAKIQQARESFKSETSSEPRQGTPPQEPSLSVGEQKSLAETPVSSVESIPATENGGRIAIVLEDGTALVGGKFHANTWNKAVDMGLVTDAQIAKAKAGFVKPDGTAWGVNGKPLPNVSKVLIVDKNTPKPTAEARQRPPEPGLAVESVTPLEPQSGTPIQQPIGMGGATPSEFTPAKTFKTSNKNATVDAERKARGLPPMMDLARQSNQSAWDEAMRKIEDQPESQDRLIAELTENPRALTTTENAMLMHRRIDLRNEYEKALRNWREAFESDDMVRAAEESQRVKDWSTKLADLENITKATGAESGRSLQARRMMALEDFSLARMEMEALEAKGRPLTNDEHIQLIRAHDRIAALEAKLSEIESRSESKEIESATDKAVSETSKEATKEAKSKDLDIDREEKLLGSIKAKLDKGEQDEITPLVQQLARVLWRRGIRQREPMLAELQKALQTIIPDFTLDQTKRAFSGYGNFKPLSKEEIDVGLRDLRGQTQQVLKMEAIESRKPLEKTGQERRVPSDEERRLIKQVNELKRKFGVVVTDPATQLKSALQSRKTYYEHRISDLKHEIETRQRIVKTKSPSPTGPELQTLIEEYERVKSEHDQIFPPRQMTDEQRLKQAIAAAEKNRAHWDVRLENAEKGIFDVRTPKREVTSPELELIRAETAAAREHVKELHSLDDSVQQQNRKQSLETQKKNLEKQILEQQRKLSEGDLGSPGKRQNRPADPELESLYQKRDELNTKLKEARKKPDSQKYEEAQQRELKRLNKAIDDRISRISSGDTSSLGSPKKQNRPSSPEIEQARQQLERVNEQLAALRKASKPVKSPEQIALQSLKARMTTQIAKLQERLAKKDFTTKKREPVKLDPEANRIKAELDTVKEEFNRQLEQDRWNKMSTFDKTKRKIADYYDAARAIMTTGELSFILRQGKLSALSHPVRTAKAIPDMFRALLGNEQRAREIDLQVLNHPDAELARQAKLYLADEGASLNKQEEAFMGRLSDRMKVVKNFNQAARVFLNRVRFDTWQAMRKSLSKSGTPTPEEDRQIAMFVNESTGRGGLGRFEPAAVGLSRIFFSPRYMMSRLQLAAGHSLWGGSNRTRKVIATEYARALVGMGLYYTLLKAAFGMRDDEKKGDVELDPRSADFGKFRMGDTRLDPLAGLSQVITLGARTASGQTKTLSGKVRDIRGDKVPYGGDKWSEVAARFGRSKLHPVPATIANLFDGTDMAGNETTVAGEAKNFVAPITYGDIYEALKAQDLPDGIALSLLAILGEGLQTYNKKKKAAPEAPIVEY